MLEQVKLVTKVRGVDSHQVIIFLTVDTARQTTSISDSAPHLHYNRAHSIMHLALVSGGWFNSTNNSHINRNDVK